jgi:hypothetical protein
MIEILTPIGRIVGGHPMKRNPVTQTTPTGQVIPVMQADGATPAMDTYVGLAIPKGPETDWKQTEWGGKIVSAAQLGWPNGEYNSPNFAWKIIDGDSQVPNQKGKKPCDREGYPGHWIINASTRMIVRCYHVGQYDPAQQIQNPEEIKPGDYGRLFIQAKANNPSQSPGVYLNPTLFELSRAGEFINLSGGPSAADAFGNGGPTQPPVGAGINQVPATGGVQAPPAPTPPVTPAPEFLNQAPKMYTVDGNQYTKEQLIAGGWTEAQINQLDVPV